MHVNFRWSASHFNVRSGSVDVNGGEFHKVLNKVVHENYDVLNAVINDIAIFEVPCFLHQITVQSHCAAKISYILSANMSKLKKMNLNKCLKVEPAFIYGLNVQPVTLPNQDDAPAVDATATVVGWGQINVNIAISKQQNLMMPFAGGFANVRFAPKSSDTNS